MCIYWTIDAYVLFHFLLFFAEILWFRNAVWWFKRLEIPPLSQCCIHAFFCTSWSFPPFLAPGFWLLILGRVILVLFSHTDIHIFRDTVYTLYIILEFRSLPNDASKSYILHSPSLWTSFCLVGYLRNNHFFPIMLGLSFFWQNINLTDLDRYTKVSLVASSSRDLF